MEGVARPFARPSTEVAVVHRITGEQIARVIADSQTQLADLQEHIQESASIAEDTGVERVQTGFEFNRWCKAQFDKFKGLNEFITEKDREIADCETELIDLRTQIDAYQSRLAFNREEIRTREVFLDDCKAYLPGARERKDRDQKQLVLLDNDIAYLQKCLATGVETDGTPIDRNRKELELQQNYVERNARMITAAESKKSYDETCVNQVGVQMNVDSLRSAIEKIGTENSATHKQIVELISKLHTLCSERAIAQKEFEKATTRLRALEDLFDVSEDEDIVEAELVEGEMSSPRRSVALARSSSPGHRSAS